MENNNKEAFQLLSVNGSESSLSDPEIPDFVVAPKKKLSKRRSRTLTSSNRATQPKPPCLCTSRTASVAVAAALLVCWLCTLSWLAFVLHSELARLDGNVQRVVAGSENVPDDLQRMHSVSRELQRNQTILSATLATLTAHITNMSVLISKVQNDLGEVRQRINNAPELVSLPQEVKDLSKNVANWGSRIQDFGSTVDTLKQQESTLAQNITSLEQRISELARQPATPAPVVPVDSTQLKALKDAADQVSANLTNVNLTLSTKLNWLQDEFNKDHAKLVKIEDGAQNASARIKTLEVQCTRAEVVDALNQTVRSLGEKLDTAGQQLQEVRSSVADLRKVPTLPPLLLQSGPTSRGPAPIAASTAFSSSPRPTPEGTAPSEPSWPVSSSTGQKSTVDV